MGKLFSKDDPQLIRWRALPGLSRLVELEPGTDPVAVNGASGDDLHDAVPNFLRIGTMLGRSLGLDDPCEVRVCLRDEQLIFAETESRRLGIVRAVSARHYFDCDDHGA